MWWPRRRTSEPTVLRAGPATANQLPKAAIPAATVSSSAISLPWRVPSTPLSAVSAVAAPALAPAGPCWALPTPGAAGAVGAGVTTGNRLARLPVRLGADIPGPVPRGNCPGRSRGPATIGDRVRSPPAAWWLRNGTGERDRLGEGEGLGVPDLLGEGEGLGEPELLGEGEGLWDGDLVGDGDGVVLGDGLGEGDLLGDGLGEGDLLGDGEGLGDCGLVGAGDTVDLPGEGDGEAVAALIAAVGDLGAGAGLTAAPALPAITVRIPAATAPPQARMRAPARALPRMRLRCWPPLRLPASLRERAAENITAAWTQPRPPRFPVHDQRHVRQCETEQAPNLLMATPTLWRRAHEIGHNRGQAVNR